MSQESMSWMRVGAALAALSLVVAACSGTTDATTTTTDAAPPSTSTTTSSTTTTTSTSTTTTTTLPPAVDAGLDLPRSQTYGHILFEITAAEFSNAKPGTYLEDDPKMGEERFLYLRYVADLEPGFPGRGLGLQVSPFALRLADGTTIGANRVDFSRTIKKRAALAFPGGDIDLSGAVLTYNNEINEPMVLTLDGPVPEDPYPISVQIDGTGEADYEGGCSDSRGTVNVLDAEWDIDGGVDHNGKLIVGAGSMRTVAGERFLRVRVQAIAGGGTCGGTVLTTSAFRLVIDGLPIGPINRASKLLKSGEGIELIWGFRVPLDATEIAFEAGEAEGVTALFPIDIPAILP